MLLILRSASTVSARYGRRAAESEGERGISSNGRMLKCIAKQLQPNKNSETKLSRMYNELYSTLERNVGWEFSVNICGGERIQLFHIDTV